MPYMGNTPMPVPWKQKALFVGMSRFDWQKTERTGPKL